MGLTLLGIREMCCRFANILHVGQKRSNFGNLTCHGGQRRLSGMAKRQTVKFATAEDELRYLVAMRRKLALAELEVVGEMLGDGYSYAELAGILGVTRQAVRQKYGHIGESSGVKGSKEPRA